MLIDAGVFAARLIVGGVLLVAGLAKIRSGPTRFLQAIVGYDLLPRPLAALMASALPWLEVLVGGLLLAGWWTHIAALLAAGLLLVFASAVALSLVRGKRQDCGCFPSLTPVQWRLVYRNVGLMGLLVPVYAFSGGGWAVDSWMMMQASGLSWFSTGLGALIAGWLAMLSTALLLQWLTRPKPVRSANSQQAQ